MKQPKETHVTNDGGNLSPATASNFHLIDGETLHNHPPLPGLYRVTFPVCEVHPVGERFRLCIRMVMRGPLECTVPSEMNYALDVTAAFPAVQEEFLRLGITLMDPRGVEEACKALLHRVEHVYTCRYVDERCESGLETSLLSPEEAGARLKGFPPAARQVRIHGSLFPSSGIIDQARWTLAERRMMSRELIAWATILRCDASPLPDKVGHEVRWEAHIDNYLDTPLIHRWTQRVDSVQSYEELRRDLEVLCVDLAAYHDIENACARALGRNITTGLPLKDITLAIRDLLEHFTEKPHQLPPLHERMTRAEAEAYVREHQLGAFADDLGVMRFREEGTPAGVPAEAVVTPPPSSNPNRPMKPLFGDTLASYDLVQPPVEPYASDPIARVGTYWLRATHCTVRKRNRFFHTHIRLEMVCEELDPPFLAVYELKRQLTYTQLCREFRKLQVVIHSKDGIQPACKSVLGDIAWLRCLPEDAPDWLCQNAGLN